MLLVRVGIGSIPEIVPERGRALAVGEEDRDRAGREVAARHWSELATLVQFASRHRSDPGSRSEHAIVPVPCQPFRAGWRCRRPTTTRGAAGPCARTTEQHPIRGSFLDPRPDPERGAVYHDGRGHRRARRPTRARRAAGRTHRVFAIEGGPVFLATPRGVSGLRPHRPLRLRAHRSARGAGESSPQASTSAGPATATGTST